MGTGGEICFGALITTRREAFFRSEKPFPLSSIMERSLTLLSGYFVLLSLEALKGTDVAAVRQPR